MTAGLLPAAMAPTDETPLSPSAVRVRAAELRGLRVPFVTATVVLAERPASAKPGDMALVLGDGRLVGFVGGECAEASVVVHALGALERAESVLLRITPGGAAPGPAPAADLSAEAAQEAAQHAAGRVVVDNPCLSGGSLEIFLEPEIPPPLVVVHGRAPIAQALRYLADALGYAVGPWRDDDAIPADAAAVVVASHGRDEAGVLRAAIARSVPYIGLVASRRRGAAVLDSLDVSESDRARIHTPAGLDIGARTPGEVALSILAEIVASRPRGATAPRAATPSGEPEQEAAAGGAAAVAVDPVCGMTVAAGGETLHADHGGRRYWFCGSGCREAFAADPSGTLGR